MTEASPDAKSDNRIEIIRWQEQFESSTDPKDSASSTISLSHIIMPGGSTGGGDKVDKLTIDNLWKILACEKPQPGAEPLKPTQQKSSSRSRMDESHKAGNTDKYRESSTKRGVSNSSAFSSRKSE